MKRALSQTPIEPKTYSRAVLAACDALGWPRLSKASVGVLHSQFIVETSGIHCWNWNLGNVKVTQAQIDAGVPWIDLPGTWEVRGGKKVVLPEGDPGRRFRAFDTLDEAMVDHLRMLRERRFKSAWPAVEAGDPELFAHKLKEGPDGKEDTWDDYYTAPSKNYAAIMKQAHARYVLTHAYAMALAELAPTVPAIVVATAGAAVVAATESEEPFQKVRGPTPLGRPELDADLADDAGRRAAARVTGRFRATFLGERPIRHA